MALNISGKEKSWELSHGFTKPLASPLPVLSLNQWLFSLTVSGTAPKMAGVLTVAAYRAAAAPPAVPELMALRYLGITTAPVEC